MYFLVSHLFSCLSTSRYYGLTSTHLVERSFSSKFDTVSRHVPLAAIRDQAPNAYPTDPAQSINTTNDEETTTLSRETILKIEELKRLVTVMINLYFKLTGSWYPSRFPLTAFKVCSGLNNTVSRSWLHICIEEKHLSCPLSLKHHLSLLYAFCMLMDAIAVKAMSPITEALV